MDLQYELGNGELRTVDTLVAGDLAVWSAVVEPYRCTASGTLRKDTKLIAINGAKLRNLMEANYDLGYRFLTERDQAACHPPGRCSRPVGDDRLIMHECRSCRR
jgi:hypothetical protein